MRYINGWRYLFKETDRFHFGLRIGVLTVFELYADVSSREWRAVLLNFGVGR